ncbi:MAG: hypothetical protein JW892_08010 [Anaerolineae bacterium]|nr:hypothetical protein [Anaerolineae bacterium]
MSDTMDLLVLVQNDTTLKRVATTHGGEYAGPCPFCGGRDRFRVWPHHPGGSGRWWCRRCERSGDSVAYLVERGALTLAQAAAIRDTQAGIVVALPKPEPAPPLLAEPPSSAWQARALQFVAYAESQLWGAQSHARQEVQQWGLNDETIRFWRLGWNPSDLYDDPVRWGLQGKRIYLPRGITIPHFSGQQLWGVKIRRYVGWQAAAAPKYIQPRRNDVDDETPHDTLFGADQLRGQSPCLLLTEGEKDCLLAWQALRDLVDVASVCGAARRFPASWLSYLLPYRAILVAYDADPAGLAGAAKLRAWAACITSIQVPDGDDIVAFAQRGGDLRAWLLFHLHRLRLLP